MANWIKESVCVSVSWSSTGQLAINLASHLSVHTKLTVILCFIEDKKLPETSTFTLQLFLQLTHSMTTAYHSNYSMFSSMQCFCKHHMG